MTIVHLRRWRVSAAALASLMLASMLAVAPGAPGRTHVDVDPAVFVSSARAVNVIVQAVDAQAGRVAHAVEHLGGRVTRRLPIIGGFSATVPTNAVEKLSRVDGVRVISLDR